MHTLPPPPDDDLGLLDATSVVTIASLMTHEDTALIVALRDVWGGADGDGSAGRAVRARALLLDHTDGRGAPSSAGPDVNRESADASAPPVELV